MNAVVTWIHWEVLSIKTQCTLGKLALNEWETRSLLAKVLHYHIIDSILLSVHRLCTILFICLFVCLFVCVECMQKQEIERHELKKKIRLGICIKLRNSYYLLIRHWLSESAKYLKGERNDAGIAISRHILQKLIQAWKMSCIFKCLSKN